MKIQLRVIAPEGILASEECEVVSLRSTSGMIEIMYGHELMMIQLRDGDITYDKNKKIHIKSGFAMVSHDLCEVVVEK